MSEGAATAEAILAELPRRLSDVPAIWAGRTPDAPALIQGDEVWSFARLEDEVARAADWLRGLGVRPGDRVMMVNENCLELAVLILAAGRIDAWAVVVNARLTAREIDTIREHSGARRVVYTVAHSSDAADHAARHGAETIEGPWGGPVAVSPLAEAEPEPVFDDPAEQVAVLIYTTGTTGRPKGVMLTHRNLLFVAAMRATAKGLDPGDRSYLVLPMSHIFGLCSGFLRTVYHGACCELVARFDPADLLDALANRGTTVFQGVPAMHARLLEYAAEKGATVHAPDLRLLSSGGAPLDPDLRDRAVAAYGVPIVNGYGLTESTATVSRSAPMEAGAPMDTGPVMPGLEYRIVDGQDADVAPGEAGRLLLRGPTIMKGYYRDPEGTAAVISPEGWYDTGDVARVAGDGQLVIVDRSKELIIRSGFNVYPAEVEAALNAHPEVTQSAVVGRTAHGNEEVVAFVERAPGSALTAEALSRFAAERLAPYKRPAHIVLVDRLPAAATGKVLKAELKRLAAELPEAAA